MINIFRVAAFLAATLFFSPVFGARELVDQVAAVVNGELVTQSALDTPQIANNGKPFSLSAYITYLLWIQRAQERHMEPPMDDVARNIAQYKKENGLVGVADDEADRLLKGKLGIDFATYASQLKDYFMIEQLKAYEFRNRCSVAEAEVRAYYQAHPIVVPAEYKIDLSFSVAAPFEWVSLDWLSEASLAPHLMVIKNIKVGATSSVVDDQGRALQVKLVDKKESYVKTLSERYHSIEMSLQKDKVAKHAHEAEAEIMKDAVIFCLE